MAGPVVNAPTTTAQVLTFAAAGITFYTKVQALRANPTFANYVAAGQALMALLNAAQAPGVVAAFAVGYTALMTALAALRTYFGV